MQLILHEYSILTRRAGAGDADRLFGALLVGWGRGAAGGQVFLNLSPSEIFNAEVLFREDCSPDEFIDVIVGNRVYMPCLYVSGARPCGRRNPCPGWPSKSLTPGTAESCRHTQLDPGVQPGL